MIQSLPYEPTAQNSFNGKVCSMTGIIGILVGVFLNIKNAILIEC